MIIPIPSLNSLGHSFLSYAAADNSVKNALIGPVPSTFDLSNPKPQHL